MTKLHTFLVGHPVGCFSSWWGSATSSAKSASAALTWGQYRGVLFVGLGFGYFGYELSPTLQTMGVVLFIFSVGLQAGPRIFAVLRTDGWQAA